MKIRNLQFASLAALLLFTTACKKDKPKGPEVVTGNGTSVRFSASINGEIKTKAVDNKWDANDAIGVFMKTGSTFSNVIAANRSYNTTGDGEFKPSAADQALFYPENGGNVDFVAYYPYTQQLSNSIYTVNVSNQSNPAAIDLMYATATGLNKTSTTANLVFSHQLSKIEIVVKNGTGVADLNGLSTSIQGVNTKADFDLATGAINVQNQTSNITAKTGVKDVAVVSEAILLPTTDETNIKVVFSLGTKTFTWTLPANTKFEKGNKYSYQVELKGEGTGNIGIAAALKAVITNWNTVPSGNYSLDQETVINPPAQYGYMETPIVNTDNNIIYVAHGFPGRTGVRNYSMLYDKRYKMAYWVAYPLHASYIGSSGRSDAWAFDPAISSADQVNLSSSFGNGFDRGHQIPSGDRTATRDLNATTFYYSNMTAQVSSMNQGIWNNLEQQVRTWTAQSDTLYVVTGAGITTATDQNITYAKGSAIPKYYYKALAMKKGDTYYTIGFRIENQIIPSGNNYNSYRVSVSDLEKETGYTFFPKLSGTVKATIDNTIWK